MQGCRTGVNSDRVCGGYRGDMGRNWELRTEQYKYVEYPDGFVQLFDLSVDPWEVTNLATDAAHAPVLADLHRARE